MADWMPILWDDARQTWACANCGHTEFWQTVVAANYVTLSSHDATTLIESDDFAGSWEVTERGTVICGNCTRELALPDVVDIVERCRLMRSEDDEDGERDDPMKW